MRPDGHVTRNCTTGLVCLGSFPGTFSTFIRVVASVTTLCLHIKDWLELLVCVTYTHSCLPWRLWLQEEVPPPASVAFGVDQSH